MIRLNKHLLKQELTAPPFLFLTGSLALLFLALTQYSLNLPLIIRTLAEAAPPAYKTKLLLTLLGGFFSMHSRSEQTLLIGIALLMGMNLSLTLRNLKRLARQKATKLSFSSGVITAVGSIGCASCGISVFSLVSPTLSMSLIPFHGLPLLLCSFGMLLFSLYHSFKTLQNQLLCKSK